MGLYFEATDIKSAISGLEKSQVDPAFFQFCILLASHTAQGKPAQTQINGSTIKDTVDAAARIQSPSQAESLDRADISYFTPLGGDFLSYKYWSNGPSDTIPKWANNSTLLTVVHGSKPKKIQLNAFDDAEIRRHFKIQDADRVYFPDLAVWWFRHNDFEGITDASKAVTVGDLSEQLLNVLGLEEDEAASIFEMPTHSSLDNEFPLVDYIADPLDYLPKRKPTLKAGQSSARPVPSSIISTYDAELTEYLISAVESSGFHFEPYLVASFLSAARAKPFIMLTGISGTGKTHLPMILAKATGSEYKIVPVKPDWTDSSELLGYFDLRGNFQPGVFLEYAKEASENPEQTYFFILDEMNLARVELYFAEVLSKMETLEVIDGRLLSSPLVTNAPKEFSDIRIPSNLIIVGSLNMDETTHTVSKKVLDRAFVLDFDWVNLTYFGSPSPSGMQPSAQKWTAEVWGANRIRPMEAQLNLDADDRNVFADRLQRLNKLLRLSRLHFGYRVRDEVLAFLWAATDQEQYFQREDKQLTPFDVAIYSKILPKIEGSDMRVGQLLSDLSDLLAVESFQLDESALQNQTVRPSESNYLLSLEKLSAMKKQFETVNYCSFWE